MKKRKAFNFYSSYDDAFEALPEKHQIKLFKAIRDVQFFRININDVVFSEPELKFAWLIIKHSIEAQVLGFCRANKVTYEDTLGVTYEDTPKQVQVQEEVQVQQVEPFTFSLTKKKQLSFTSKEYQEKLIEYISNSGKSMSYQDFFNQCEMQGYQYKNFKLAYDSWTKSEKAVSVKKSGGVQC